MKTRFGFFAILVSIFILPYFFALAVSGFSLRLPRDFGSLVVISTSQAALSAIGALLFGFVGTLGLLKKPLRTVGRWESLALAPSVVPAIAIVLGFMSVFPTWRGVTAVVAAHTISSAGLVAVVLNRVIRGSLGASLELGWIEGASRRAIWRKGVFPALRGDLFRLGLSVFAASLASFSIPLLLGGSKAVTVEIAIHHAIRFENAWDIAAALSIFQWVFLLLFVLLLKGSVANERRAESDIRSSVGRVLGFQSATAVLFATPALVLAALARGPLLGWTQLESAGLFEHFEILSRASSGSLVTSTLAGVFAAAVLFAMAAVFPSARVRVWMSGYIAPSVAITGFATLLIGWGRDPSLTLDSLRISIGAALLFAPVLWRLRWERRLSDLEGQVRVAQTLGAPHSMIVFKILAPQLREIAFWSGGLVSFWVWGDYALGSIAASRPMTLALVAKGLLESYRLEAASLMILICLVMGGFSYALFSMGGSRVAR